MAFERMRALIQSQPYHLFLPFLAVWLIKPIYGGTRSDWVLLGIAYAAFAVFYALAHSRAQSRYVTGLLGLSTLGALYIPLNPEASGIFSFVVAVLASRLARVSYVALTLAAINALLLAEVFLYHLNIWSWIGGGGGAVLFSLYVLQHARERETNLQLRLAQNEISGLAKLAERERISRTLHDVLGHTLSLIVIKSELAQKRFSADPQAAFSEAREIETIARQALLKVREAIHGYVGAPVRTEVDRIAAELRSVDLIVECHLEEASTTSLQDAVFSTVLEEASTNILRHAHASRCLIQLLNHEDTVELLIQDNGRGAAAYEGFGIRGMRERLRLLGGSLEIVADNGTTLRARLPHSQPS